MATLSINAFGGMVPLRGERKRPIGTAEHAQNTNLESADLQPIYGSEAADAGVGGAAFRVPAALRGDIPNPPPASVLDANDAWFWFTQPYTHFHQTPVANDQYNRWYWTEEGSGMSYAPFSDLLSGTTYRLGVPRPTTDPLVTPAHVPLNLSLAVFPTNQEQWFSLAAAYVDLVFKRQLFVEGGIPPYAYELVSGSLPPGIVLDERVGTVSGTPSLAGSYTANFRVTDDVGTQVVSSVTIAVSASPFTGTATLTHYLIQPPSGNVGISYAHSFATEGGAVPRTFRLVKGALPPGIVLDSAGVMYGTPTDAGVFRFSVDVFDADGTTITRDYVVTIYNNPYTPLPTFTFVTRCYVYTHVTQWGEESAPSPPVCSEGAEGELWTIGLPVLSTPSPYDGSIVTKRRIYRTVTGDTGGSFFLVAELPIATTSYADVTPTDEVSLNTQLESDFWEPPPIDLVGLQKHPNGFFVAFSEADSTLHFSEVNRPHAWPPQYDIAIEGGIQGITISNGAIVVLTNTVPYVIAGTNPASLTLIKTETAESCVSRFGVVSTPGGVIYPSKNGLVLLSGTTTTLLTQQLLSFEDWQGYNPEGVFLARHKSSVIGIPSGAPAFLVSPQQPNAQFAELSLISDGVDPVPTSLVTDRYAQEAYWVEGGAARWFDRLSQPALPYLWLSSEIGTPQPLNWGAFTIALDGAGDVTLALYSVDRDGVATLRHTVALTEGGNYRLPSGYQSAAWKVSLAGTARVASVVLAETMLGLREA